MIQEDRAAEALAEVEIAANAYRFEPYEQFNFQRIAQLFLTARHRREALQVAAIASRIIVHQGFNDDPRFASPLIDWAGFYKSQLEDRATARLMLEKAGSLIRGYSGDNSHMLEAVLRERARLNEEPRATIAALEKLRDFEISVFGANNQRVENTTLEIARLYGNSGEHPQAARLYEKALTIGMRRTGGYGREYVQLLSTVSMAFANQGDYPAALMLNALASRSCTGFLFAEQMSGGLEAEHRQIEAMGRADERSSRARLSLDVNLQNPSMSANADYANCPSERK